MVSKFARRIEHFPSALRTIPDGLPVTGANGAAPSASDAEERISNVIPSVELKGSRADKLRQLDALIVYLERLRRSLAGHTGHSGFEGPSRYAAAPSWPWFAAGVLATMAVLLLFITARGCA